MVPELACSTCRDKVRVLLQLHLGMHPFRHPPTVSGRLRLRILTHCQGALRKSSTRASAKNTNGTAGLHLACRFDLLKTDKFVCWLGIGRPKFRGRRQEQICSSSRSRDLRRPVCGCSCFSKLQLRSINLKLPFLRVPCLTPAAPRVW